MHLSYRGNAAHARVLLSGIPAGKDRQESLGMLLERVQNHIPEAADVRFMAYRRDWEENGENPDNENYREGTWIAHTTCNERALSLGHRPAQQQVRHGNAPFVTMFGLDDHVDIITNGKHGELHTPKKTARIIFGDFATKVEKIQEMQTMYKAADGKTHHVNPGDTIYVTQLPPEADLYPLSGWTLAMSVLLAKETRNYADPEVPPAVYIHADGHMEGQGRDIERILKNVDRNAFR